MPQKFCRSRWLSLTALSVAALSSGCGANHAVVPETNPAVILSVIPYHDLEVADQETRDYCDWNRQLASNIAENSEGRAVINDAAFAEPGGRKLTVTIVGLHAIGGGGFTGPKWAVIQGKLTQDGQIIGSFEKGRNTIHGSFSACKTMRNLGEELADDVAEWLEHPKIDPTLKD